MRTSYALQRISVHSENIMPKNQPCLRLHFCNLLLCLLPGLALAVIRTSIASDFAYVAIVGLLL